MNYIKVNVPLIWRYIGYGIPSHSVALALRIRSDNTKALQMIADYIYVIVIHM